MSGDKTANFSKDLAELEKIVAWFESDDVDLDKALERFERGMELATRLKKHLDGVENKVEVIKRKFNSDLPTGQAGISSRVGQSAKIITSEPEPDPGDENDKSPHQSEKTKNPNDDPLNLF